MKDNGYIYFTWSANEIDVYMSQPFSFTLKMWKLVAYKRYT